MTQVRLAWAHPGNKTRAGNALAKREHPMTDVRLAHCTADRNPNMKHFQVEGAPMTDVRLAMCGPPKALASGLPKLPRPHGDERHPASEPSLLVSYVYLSGFLKARAGYGYRDWVMDSGAFSAHASGTEVDFPKFIKTAKHLLSTDPKLVEVFALDVIGDWKASLKNCEAMWKAGVPAIPTYHVGEPVHVLKTMAAQYPKIALGGAVGYRRKTDWAKACFDAVWPKAIHGLGFCSETALLSVPFHSVDATNWESGPCMFGNWKTYGKMSVRGGAQNLRAEVQWYLKLEHRARWRWRKALAELPALPRSPAQEATYG